MTHPGGGTNDINLAALWIPVMPETSHMGEEMRRAGGEAKRQFEQGFNSGMSPESMGQTFGSKLTTSLGKEFKNFELPFGASAWVDRMSGDIDQKLVSKLRGEASTAMQNYRGEYEKLTAAQGQAAEAESRLAVAREGGFNKASIMLPLIQENTRAQNQLTEAHGNAAVALGVYNDKAGKLSEAQSAAADSGKMLAGVMGGLMVVGAQLAVGGIEKLVEVAVEGFKSAIDITVELAKKTVELGETYEHIGIQVHEFSTATGEDFAKLEESAQHVFSTLDVAGQDTGKTMAQLASMLNTEPGPALELLTKHVVELQGRFSSLRATDLAASFNAFKVPAAEADTALASLLQSARGSGQDLGQLSSALSGNVAITLHEAGLDIEQAGKFTADLMKLGEPGRQVMTGMAMAMKEFGKEGISFSDGMRLAGQRLNELGDTAEGQDLAQKLFGGRNWVVAKDAVKDYLNIIDAAPGSFAATTASTQEFLDQTENLGNKIEEFKHKAEEAFKPFGKAAEHAVEHGLNLLSHWFDTHHHEIIGKIKEWGNKLIDALPQIQAFTADAIRMFGDFTTALLMMFGPVAQTLAVAGAGFMALSGHFKDAKDLLVMVNNFDPGKIKEATDKIANNIQDFKYNSQALHDSWNGIADSADRVSATVGSGLGQGFSALSPPGAPAPGPTGSFGLGGPSSPWFGGGGGTTGGGPPVAPGMHHADWDAIAAKESTSRWNEPTPGPVPYGGGLQIKPDTWYEFGGLAFAQNPFEATKEQQIEIAERVLNGWGTRPGQGPKAWDNGKTYVERKQHGGIAEKRDRWDPPVIDPGNPIQPKDYSSVGEYLMAVNLANLLGAAMHAKGHARGDYVTGGKGGTDDVPALLTAGEYVWDTETVDKYGWLIKGLHQGGMKGFDAGGAPGEDPHTGGSGVLQVIYSNTATGQKTGEAGGQAVGPGTTQPGYYGADWGGHQGHVHTSFATSPTGEFYGLPKGTDIRQGQSGFPAWVYALGQQFGVEASTYSGHQEGSGFNRGIDWWPKGHADMSGASYTSEEKARLQTFATAVASFGGERGGSSGSPTAWGMSAPMGFGMPRGGDNYPGMPGQYGGYGVYGGETEDQRRQLDKAVQQANDRKADLDHQVIVNQRSVDDLKDQIKNVGVSTKLDAFGKPYPLTPDEQAKVGEKTKKLNEQLDDATHTLEKSRRDAAEQTDNITDAERKRQEGAYKKPSSASTSSQKVTGESEFQALGAGLLKGIGQELGFGDIFAKPPWEWGAVKLLTGAAGYAIGTANAWGDYLTKQGGGAPGTDLGQGGGAASGLLSGLSGSFGLNLPSAVSSGPNIVPQQPPGPFGPPTGPAPGPPIINNDNSIHVSSDVSDTKVLAPVQELQNSQNSQLHGQTGGLPAS